MAEPEHGRRRGPWQLSPERVGRAVVASGGTYRDVPQISATSTGSRQRWLRLVASALLCIVIAGCSAQSGASPRIDGLDVLGIALESRAERWTQIATDWQAAAAAGDEAALLAAADRLSALSEDTLRLLAGFHGEPCVAAYQRAAVTVWTLTAEYVREFRSALTARDRAALSQSAVTFEHAKAAMDAMNAAHDKAAADCG